MIFQPEQINQAACDIAWDVAKAKKTLVAGGITQTKAYTYQNTRDKKLVQKTQYTDFENQFCHFDTS